MQDWCQNCGRPLDDHTHDEAVYCAEQVVVHTERFPAAAEAIASLDEENQRIVLLRLAAKSNNGSEHFDHSPVGSSSWLCLACFKETLNAVLDRQHELRGA